MGNENSPTENSGWTARFEGLREVHDAELFEVDDPLKLGHVEHEIIEHANKVDRLRGRSDGDKDILSEAEEVAARIELLEDMNPDRLRGVFSAEPSILKIIDPELTQ